MAAAPQAPAVHLGRDHEVDQRAALSQVGARQIGEFEDLRIRRQELDQQMLADHYQYRSKYTPTEIAAIQKVREDACRLYLGFTRTKVRTMDARINEMAFGSARKNWEIEPTPVPDVSEETLQEAMAMSQSDPEMGRLSEDELIRMAARARAERMSLQIEDHLVEADYERKFRTVTHTGHKLRVGILKGPLVTKQMRRRWGKVFSEGDEGVKVSEWKMPGDSRSVPYYEAVTPWDMYLEWSARRPQESDWYFQRHLYTRNRLAVISRNETFFQGRLAEWLRSAPDGDSQWETWEQELFTSTLMPAMRRRWETIEGWGALTPEELLQLGMERQMKEMGLNLDEISAALMECHVWLKRDGEIVGLALNPNQDETRPYTFYTPMPDDDSVYGTSFPESTRDLQKALNAAFRMCVDNAATSVLPQIEMRVGRMLSQGDLTRMTPGRIWQTKEEPWNSANPAIQFTDFPNHTAVFLSLINAFQVLFDEVGAVPRYQHGQGGSAGRTASGLAMLMGAAGQLVKDQLRSFDDFQAEVLRKQFNWEMQYNPDDSIKGDMRVRVTTTTSVLQKAEQAMAMREFRMSTANQVDAIYTKRRPMLEDEVAAMDLDPKRIIKTADEMKAEMEMMAAAAAQQQEEEAGMPGAEPEAQMGQPPPPAPGAAPGSPPQLAEGGVVTESLANVVDRMHPDHFGPAQRMARGGPPRIPIMPSINEDYDGLNRDYAHLIGDGA